MTNMRKKTIHQIVKGHALYTVNIRAYVTETQPKITKSSFLISFNFLLFASSL